MIIKSDEEESYIEFDPIPELSSMSFQISAALKGRRVAYGDIALLKSAEFIVDLKSVCSDLSGSASMEGTYEFDLTIEADKHKRLWLSFYLAEYLAMAVFPEREFMRLSLEGTFRIPGERVETLFGDFEALLGNA